MNQRSLYNYWSLLSYFLDQAINFVNDRLCKVSCWINLSFTLLSKASVSRFLVSLSSFFSFWAPGWLFEIPLDSLVHAFEMQYQWFTGLTNES
ncbi:MAG: hypothetical protein IPP42_01800 [Saprospiraceae bacterium]|nr:hypothetical protein [Saprospiraceae bacterium]